METARLSKVSKIVETAATVGTQMRQHSGAWAYLAAILLAATAIFEGVSLSHRAALADPGRGATGLHLPSLHLMGRAEPSEATGPSSGDFAIGGESVYFLSVPRNSVVIVGSLDPSGAPHIVSVDANSKRADSLDGTRAEAQSMMTCHRLSHGDVTLGDVTSHDEKTSVAHIHSSSSDHHFSGNYSSDPGPVRPSLPDGTPVRKFLIPHFEQTATINEAREATLVTQSERISVYVDHSLCDFGSLQQRSGATSRIIESANKVCCRIESALLDHVTMWVGPIIDLDSDQRLTVVITDLDRRIPPTDAPVLGCVRDRDFLNAHETDLSGDILYLDSRMPEGKSLDALLVHELTHAAIFSLILQSRAGPDKNGECAIPSWLNEAIAHVVEATVTDEPEGFARRVRQFRADTAGCPVVASETYLPFPARRGGCRASAAQFLQQFLGTPDVLRSLIQSSEPIDQRLESITGRPFREIFRTWSARQTQTAQHYTVANSGKPLTKRDRLTQRLFGTAFFSFRCEESIEDLQISSDINAALQITVIDEPVPFAPVTACLMAPLGQSRRHSLSDESLARPIHPQFITRRVMPASEQAPFTACRRDQADSSGITN